MPASKREIILLTSATAGLKSIVSKSSREYRQKSREICLPDGAGDLGLAVHKVNFLEDLLLAILAEIFLAVIVDLALARLSDVVEAAGGFFSVVLHWDSFYFGISVDFIIMPY